MLKALIQQLLKVTQEGLDSKDTTIKDLQNILEKTNRNLDILQMKSKQQQSTLNLFTTTLPDIVRDINSDNFDRALLRLSDLQKVLEGHD